HCAAMAKTSVQTILPATVRLCRRLPGDRKPHIASTQPVCSPGETLESGGVVSMRIGAHDHGYGSESNAKTPRTRNARIGAGPGTGVEQKTGLQSGPTSGTTEPARPAVRADDRYPTRS